MDYLTIDFLALIAEADLVVQDAKQKFGMLSFTQLNWKPGPEQWGVGECFEHLIMTNLPYFPIFEKIAKGEKQSTLWERMPFLPGFFGRVLINAVSPNASGKHKTSKRFQPGASQIDKDIINRFAEHQAQLIRHMKPTQHLELNQIIITSPAMALITYNLLDAYRILIAHERRHLQQAERVVGLTGFPKI